MAFKIPLRPTEYETTLPDMEGIADRPIFVYAALTPEEEADWALRGAEASGAFEPEEEVEDDAVDALYPAKLRRLTRLYCELFDTKIVRIDKLQVGEEPFDRERHLAHIPGRWKVAIGREILSRINAPLTPAEEGN